MRRRPMLYALGAGVAVMLAGFVVGVPAGPASAQDGPQPPLAQPLGNVPPGQPTTDPITNEQIELLKDGGLIDKQSRLSEGLLLMDRQLRQAELVQQLLTVLGPDAEIEVTPGEFKSFADTPAGLKQRIDYLKLQADLHAAKLAMGAGQETGTEITEIYGKSDDLVAVITLDGRETAVVAGDRLADGAVVLNITPEKVELADQDGAIRVLKAP
jgi:type IV pilus biogenesis protein PilP